MKKRDEWDGIDGRPITYSLAHIYEMQMWQDIAKWRKENPSLFRINLNNVKPIGKVMIISTVEEGNTDMMKLWDDVEKPNDMYRVFIPSLYNHQDDETDNL